ncbi:MAG: hydroxymethylpyrimidine/phosphomethylpyrimidine kinase [Coxiella sp. (in: Bacteria)]|nr:MAG: hydroxymethylpyrimidine/phosphomethylpyrimidine kinase [Coxiella sp. (in: g-proteobacteria)]
MLAQSLVVMAGYDSSEGAGITVDKRVAIALGLNVIDVVTANTIQTQAGVQSVTPTTVETLTQQFSAIDPHAVAAIKIGLLYHADTINVVADFIKDYTVPIILDPVLAASKGGALLLPEALPLLQSRLIPHVTLLTPNIPEAETLLQRPLTSRHAIETAAQQFRSPVLIKGGHGTQTDCADYLYAQGEGQWFESQRLDVTMRGTGCRLSTAIACYLANGCNLKESVKKAKEYVYNRLLQHHERVSNEPSCNN